MATLPTRTVQTGPDRIALLRQQLGAIRLPDASFSLSEDDARQVLRVYDALPADQQKKFTGLDLAGMLTVAKRLSTLVP